MPAITLNRDLFALFAGMARSYTQNRYVIAYPGGMGSTDTELPVLECNCCYEFGLTMSAERGNDNPATKIARCGASFRSRPCRYRGSR